MNRPSSKIQKDGVPYDRTPKESLFLAKLAFGVSLFAFLLSCASLLFSYLDWEGDKQWQKQQLEVLKDISKKLDAES